MSLLVHTVVLLGLALVVRVDGARDVAVAIISTSVVDAPLEELDFEPLEAVEVPEEVEATAVDPGPVASDDESAALAFDDPVDIASPSSAPVDMWAAYADDGLLLASVGGDGDGGVGTSFYGLSARGQKFVFVTDCSSSMTGKAFTGLLRELHATIEGLPESADFAVIFFNDGPLVRSALTLERATDGAKKGYLEWIDSVRPSGGTDPSEALAEALRLKPSVVFLLTDGQFESASTLNVIKKFNRYRRVRIHAIALGSHADVKILRQIATKNRGELKVVRD